MEFGAPTPIFLKNKEEKNILDTKKYNISLDKKEFKIHLYKLSSKISIKIEETNSVNNYYYKSDFTLDELKAINKSFRICDTINEAFNAINDIFINNKINITKESMEEIILHLNICSFSSSKTDDIALKIKREFFEKETIDELLLKIIKHIKENALNDRLNLEKKINLLEQSLNEEKKKNINLEKTVNKLIQAVDELMKWKNDTQEKNNSTIESNIIDKKEELDLLVNRLKRSQLYKNKNPTFNLIYRASKDGDDPIDYYNKCNGKKNTICIIQTKKGCKFGGYSEVVMDFNKGESVKDPNSFIISFNKLKIYENLKKNNIALDNCKGWGPIFRNDAFVVYNKQFFSYNSHTVGTISESNYGVMDDDYEINNGERNFSIQELEVFQINY